MIRIDVDRFDSELKQIYTLFNFDILNETLNTRFLHQKITEQKLKEMDCIIKMWENQRKYMLYINMPYIFQIVVNGSDVELKPKLSFLKWLAKERHCIKGILYDDLVFAATKVLSKS